MCTMDAVCEQVKTDTFVISAEKNNTEITSMPEWLDKKETTRSRSKKQETQIAKDLKGRTTLNSGATFGENDVLTDYCDVEAKTTKHKSYSLTMKEWDKLNHKTKIGKMPIFVVQFENDKKSLAVIDYNDLKYLISRVNGK